MSQESREWGRELARAHAVGQEAIVSAFNQRFPLGAKVAYHPIRGEADFRVREVRHLATVLGGHTAVAWLKGESGCVCIEGHCFPPPVEKWEVVEDDEAV